MDITQFVYPFSCFGHMSYFLFGTVMNKVFCNIHVQINKSASCFESSLMLRYCQAFNSNHLSKSVVVIQFAVFIFIPLMINEVNQCFMYLLTIAYFLW